MSYTTNLDECVMKGLKVGMFELIVVEAEEVIHDDVAGQGGKGMRKIERLCRTLKLLHPHRKSVDMAINDVNEVKN